MVAAFPDRESQIESSVQSASDESQALFRRLICDLATLERSFKGWAEVSARLSGTACPVVVPALPSPPPPPLARDLRVINQQKQRDDCRNTVNAIFGMYISLNSFFLLLVAESVYFLSCS